LRADTKVFEMSDDTHLFLQNNDDVDLAHKYRISLKKPRQSSFRVVALMFLCENDQQSSDDESNSFLKQNAASPLQFLGRKYVVGVNDEPCHISGSICAERSAMVQLRLMPDIIKVSKIVIVTDAPHEITPGLLCREFMSSSPLVPSDVRIVLGGSSCKKCGLQYQIHRNAGSECEHNFIYKIVSLLDLYPYPSPYIHMTALQAFDFGKSFLANNRHMMIPEITDVKHKFSKSVLFYWDELLAKSQKSSNFDTRDELHPIRYGAAVLYSDGSIDVAHEKKGLEYGCTLDAVEQLAPLVHARCTVPNGELEQLLVRPILLVQTDQFGIAHAPYARGRAFFAEHGYGDCLVLVHNHNCDRLLAVTVDELVPGVPKMADGILIQEN